MKLFAFDLDYTFLDDDKCISRENIEALEEAQSRGIHAVVSTGRFFTGIPEELRKRCRYFITINGSKVFDSKTGHIIYESTIPTQKALDVYAYADEIDCVYDAYIGDTGYMTQSMREKLEDYVPDKKYAVTMLKQRAGVDNLKDFIRDNRLCPQKIQYFFKDLSLRETQLAALPVRFPDLKFSMALGSNIEINSYGADKGIALEALCSYLGIDISESVAFGDGLNDIAMLKAAGISYCMSNGDDRVKALADRITEYDCNNSGVGRELQKLFKNE